MVEKTKTRDNTAASLRHLLELWEKGARLDASVVLHADGTGRFSIHILDLTEADTSPQTPLAIAKDGVDCSCRGEGCPLCE